MTNKVTLRDIHKDNKAINRNLQRLANIELIRLLGRVRRRLRKRTTQSGSLLQGQD